MNTKKSGRRRFLKDGAALAGLVAGAGAIQSVSGQSRGSETPAASPKDLSAHGERAPYVTSIRRPSGAGSDSSAAGSVGSSRRYRVSAMLTPLQDSAGIITPSSLHYISTHGYTHPIIDPRQHRLMIHGMVDRPLIFTVEELKRLPSVSRIYFIECAGNTSPARLRNLTSAERAATTIQTTHGWTSCSEWTGVPLSLLLQEAGVQKGARWLIAEGAEPGNHHQSLLMEKAMDDMLVAYSQNGEPVRPENGFPLRLVVPGWHGVRNIKWLRRIKVVDQPYMTRWETTLYPSLRLDGKARWFYFEMGPKSVITFPASGGQRPPNRGFNEITGLAWSGGGAIRRVEVSTDGGRTWKDAQLQEPVLRFAHTRFRSPWNWNGEEAVLQSRSTDERGDVQPTVAEITRVWGVNQDYWLSSTNGLNHFNAIQPWKVTREGRVHNAMF